MGIATEIRLPEFARDPYPFYARWRRDDPVQFDERVGAWFTTTYADAVGILRDARFRVCKPARRPGRDEKSVDRLFEMAYRWLLYENPPNHTRLRRLLNHALALDFVSGLGIESIVEAILDECADRGSFDVITDVAKPISVMVLGEAMGLPAHDRSRFRTWSDLIGRFVDGSLRPATVDVAAQAVGEAVEYLTPIVSARRSAPGHDIISRLASARDIGDESSDADVMAMSVLLLATEQETTVSLTGNGIVALLEHPAELERLRREPGLGALAVEEFLRFDSPVQIVTRLPDRDVEWAGARFAKDSQVNILLGSANRDPAQFPDADRLDVGRTKNAHVAFGAGIHLCPGAGMARIVTRIAVRQMLERFPNLTLGPGDPVRRSSDVVRSFVSIPVQT
jgi:cytochrome P450